MEKVEAAYEALCYHASGEALRMQSECGWGCCMHDERWACGERAREVPGNCEGDDELRERAKERLQEQWPGAYERMRARIAAWLTTARPRAVMAGERTRELRGG